MPKDLSAGGPRRRWLGRPFLLTGTALVAVVAGAGIAFAATSGPSYSSSSAAGSAGSLSATSSAAPQTPRTRCVRVVTPRRAGALCRRSGLSRALHGTLVLPRSGGGTVTVEIQNGKVTSVSQSSITLKSTDDFVRTYAVTASTIVAAQRDGIGSVKVGDQVWVTATASGGTVTAIRVRDLSQLRAGLSSSFSGGSAGG